MATKTARSSSTRPKGAQGAQKAQGTAKPRTTAKTGSTSKARSTAKPQSSDKAQSTRRTRGNVPETGIGQDNRDTGRLTVTIPRTVVSAAAAPFAIAGRVLPAKKGLPVYAGLGALAAGGAIGWPVAAGIGVAYASMRRWGRAPADEPSGSRSAARRQPASSTSRSLRAKASG